MAQTNNLFLLIHTMTITETNFVVQAQFFHTFSEDIANARLVAKRMRMKVHPFLKGSRQKEHLQRLNSSNLKTLMKRNSSNIKHHLRTVRLNPQIQNTFIPRNENVITNIDDTEEVQTVIPKFHAENKSIVVANNTPALSSLSSPEETVQWLSKNRFEKYASTFEQFSGDDMLRMNRDDLIQICGDADGIRLHNALHLKTIPPKLKIYVCKEKSSVYNAIFLSSHCSIELLEKLSVMLGVSHEQVRDIYLEGPHSIHIHLTDDVLKHIKEETMFSLEVMRENNIYILLLKRTVK